MTLGEIIRNYRLEKEISLKDFAKLSGLSKPYISMLEANKNSRDGKPIKPSVVTLQKVSRAVNISLNDLLRLLDGEQLINLDDTTDEEVSELMLKYKKLNSINRQQILNIMSAFIAQQKSTAV